jgi:thioredoxin
MAFVTQFAVNNFLPPPSLHRSVLGRCNLRAARRVHLVATAAPLTVDAEKLEEILKSKPGPLLVDVYATWCGPCQLIIPELDKLSASMGDRIQVLKMNSDENADYATAIGVRALPTLYFIQDGQLKYKMEGAATAEALEEMAEHFFYGKILALFLLLLLFVIVASIRCKCMRRPVLTLATFVPPYVFRACVRHVVLDGPTPASLPGSS